jgi:hypothetical protein
VCKLHGRRKIKKNKLYLDVVGFCSIPHPPNGLQKVKTCNKWRIKTKREREGR